MQEKRNERKKQQEARNATKGRRTEPAANSSSDEEAADAPAPVNMCNDSSEYSDELAEELEPDASSYPFVEKEPAVRDFFFNISNFVA